MAGPQPFYARLHEMSRGINSPDSVDLYVKTSKGELCHWATVYIDFFTDTDEAIKARLQNGEEVELYWSTVEPQETS